MISVLDTILDGLDELRDTYGLLPRKPLHVAMHPDHAALLSKYGIVDFDGIPIKGMSAMPRKRVCIVYRDTSDIQSFDWLP